jgi:DNA (cytosine-5)-methyltransferase 1
VTPRLLDLFCGAGGAAVGYHRAGFDIVGIDIEPQPHYPFTFHQGDAMTWPLDGYDAIHASPPCQGYSRMRHLTWLRDTTWPMLLEPTWRRLVEHGTPWVIENVEDAAMAHSTVLCGLMFGLPMYRHRRFGASDLIMSPAHPKHMQVIHAGRGNLADRYRQGGGRDVVGLLPGATLADVGLDFMPQRAASQAIPPAYTEHIGRQLLTHIQAAA